MVVKVLHRNAQNQIAMDKQTLKEKIDGALGSTPLTLSDRTQSEYLDVILKGITDDAQVTDEYINGHVAILRSLDGNLHADVAAETNKNKTKWESDFKTEWEKTHPTNPQPPSPAPPQSNPNPGDALAEQIKAMQKQLEEMRQASERTAAEKNKAEVVSQVRKAFEDKLKEGGLEANAYILGNSLKELSVPDKDADVRDLAAKLEKNYYANLKAAGIVGNATPGRGRGQGGKETSAAKSFWERKQMREGWGKGAKSEGK